MSLLGPAHVLPGPVDLQPRLADLAHSLHSTHFSVIPVTAHLVTIHGIPDAGEGDLWKAASWARGRSEMDKELGGGAGGRESWGSPGLGRAGAGAGVLGAQGPGEESRCRGEAVESWRRRGSAECK